MSSIQLTCSEEINLATFTPQQMTLTGPTGPIKSATIDVVSGPNNHQFVISFPPQTAAGTYSLTVGPAIQDFYGNKMNQNRNGVNGETADAFKATFVSSNPMTARPIAPHGPMASSIYGVIATPALTDPTLAPTSAVPAPASEIRTVDFTTCSTRPLGTRKQTGPNNTQ
jgi:hypothetical protein